MRSCGITEGRSKMPNLITAKRLVEIKALRDGYGANRYDIPRIIATLERAVELVRNEGGCRCKCSTHGYGCGVAEATCRLEMLCQRCKFIMEFDR